jgi:hypothetical protein
LESFVGTEVIAVVSFFWALKYLQRLKDAKNASTFGFCSLFTHAYNFHQQQYFYSLAVGVQRGRGTEAAVNPMGHE